MFYLMKTYFQVERLQQLVDSLRQCTEEQNTKMEDYIQKLKEVSNMQLNYNTILNIHRYKICH